MSKSLKFAPILEVDWRYRFKTETSNFGGFFFLPIVKRKGEIDSVVCKNKLHLQSSFSTLFFLLKRTV